MPRYQWEPNSGITGRYRDTKTGRFLSNKAVRADLDAFIGVSDDAVATLADALRSKTISLADWELAMRREIKRAHLNAIALERGGWANMRPSDYGRAGQIIRDQYGYLKNFGNEIASGKQRLDGTLGVRAKLYTSAGRTSYYESKHANRKAEITHVQSNRSARDSCVECVALDGVWFRIGDPRYKLPGQRICRGNCRCSERYGMFGESGEVEMVETA